MNKDQIKGRMKKGKGKVKTAAGKAVGNERLQFEGKVDEAAGSVQAGLGDLKSDLKQ